MYMTCVFHLFLIVKVLPYATDDVLKVPILRPTAWDIRFISEWFGDTYGVFSALGIPLSVQKCGVWPSLQYNWCISIMITNRVHMSNKSYPYHWDSALITARAASVLGHGAFLGVTGWECSSHPARVRDPCFC